MATLEELHSMDGTTGLQALKNKIVVAVAIKAEAIAELASPTVQQIEWAKSALNNPRSVADQIINYVVADNAAASTSEITGATDAAIQTAVDAAVDNLLSK